MANNVFLNTGIVESRCTGQMVMCIYDSVPLGRPRRRWIDNIKMGLLEIGVSVVDWIGLAQDRYRLRALVNSVMNLRVP
jgi:hypothetical protein